jgi:hypothetical protein
MSKTKEELELAVKIAQTALNEANAALEAFETSAENNVFESIDLACYHLEDVMRDRAFQDCQGAYNCGDDNYTQEFIVDGIHYLARIDVEYDRHDKTYYFIEECKFSYTKIEG